jgi:hypothetical protein
MKDAPMNSQQPPHSPTEIGGNTAGSSQQAPSTPQMLARQQSVGENAAGKIKTSSIGKWEIKITNSFIFFLIK